MGKHRPGYVGNRMGLMNGHHTWDWDKTSRLCAASGVECHYMKTRQWFMGQKYLALCLPWASELPIGFPVEPLRGLWQRNPRVRGEFCFCFLCFETGSHIFQTNLKLPKNQAKLWMPDSPASTSGVVGLQLCTTSSRL